MPRRIETHLLRANGLVPNNPSLPLKLYRQALAIGAREAERAIIAQFASNGWVGAWINGIYAFHHYHATAHEVLGIARGEATVVFGGPAGLTVDVAAGDAVLIPAGVGHCRIDGSADLSVVGAYPRSQENYDLKRESAAEYAQAMAEIPHVEVPEQDPVTGQTPVWVV